MNVDKIREDFPVLNRRVNGKPLIYLDSAATAQKPRQVIEAIVDFYEKHNANTHRGVYTLSEEATELYEGARKKVARFIGAKPEEIIFTRNATEAINLVRFSFGNDNNNIREGEKIVSTWMEHHSNLVPWQLLAKERKLKMDFIEFNKTGHLNNIERKVQGAKFLAFIHVSNVLGTINDSQKICKIAHDAGATTLVDGAQSVPHMQVDVKKMDCDFLAFSGHKMLGPAGIGVLYGKKELLEGMPPFMGGGDMIKEVSLRESSWNDLPWKFEAGTPNVEGAIGLGAAIDYLNKIGMDNIRKHETELVEIASEEISKVKDVKIYGPGAQDRCGIVSFNIDNIHSHDLASLLNDDGIAIRSGHHCAMPLMEKLGICNAARASFYVYSRKEEIDLLIEGLKRARQVFRLDNG